MTPLNHYLPSRVTSFPHLVSWNHCAFISYKKKKKGKIKNLYLAYVLGSYSSYRANLGADLTLKLRSQIENIEAASLDVHRGLNWENVFSVQELQILTSCKAEWPKISSKTHEQRHTDISLQIRDFFNLQTTYDISCFLV